MKRTTAVIAAALALIAAEAPAQKAASAEALALRKEMVDIQFAASTSADGAARREALHRAELAYREALAKIPEFQAIEAERAALREKMQELARRQTALEAKYAAQLAAVKQPRDAAMQQLQSALSGGSRGQEIRARLDVIAPVPAAK